jgi:hypothetical protein
MRSAGIGKPAFAWAFSGISFPKVILKTLRFESAYVYKFQLDKGHF